MTIIAKDSSPIRQLTADDRAWLGRLATVTATGDLVLRLEEGRENEPVVRCEFNGDWWAGRYIGTITFEGRSIEIKPRFGEETLARWVAGAFNVALVETSGIQDESDSFIARLLARIWTKLLTDAARHTLPALRSDVLETGIALRGRLQIPKTVGLRASGNPGAASLRRAKSLDHAVSTAIVAAWARLARELGHHGDWLDKRSQDIIGQMIAVVGVRPQVPTQAEIRRVRLTPITAGFQAVAELSHRIASGEGLLSRTSEGGHCVGVLLDVAEIWELFVLNAMRRAWPDLEISHGTRDLEQSGHLLKSQTSRGLGWMKPDLLIQHQGRNLLVADAKYKRLHPLPPFETPPKREDLYQIFAYSSRWNCEGMLVYPEDPDRNYAPDVEQAGDWLPTNGSAIKFVTLPGGLELAAKKLRSTMISISSHSG